MMGSVLMKHEHVNKYLRRNLIQARAVGAHEVAKSALLRLRRQKRASGGETVET